MHCCYHVMFFDVYLDKLFTRSDRQVILGNHHDALVFGAVDPNSGTAVLMELARSLFVLRASSWRPGRTLVLCVWDSKKYVWR